MYAFSIMKYHFMEAVWQFKKYLHLFMQISKTTYTISFERRDEKGITIFINFTWKNLTNERGVGVWKK